MKLKNIFTVIWMTALMVAGCTPEQDVEPVDSIENNPRVTITPGGDYSSVSEGDILTFEISVDKMIRYPLAFEVALIDGSVADGNDIITESATLAPFAKSTTISIVVAPDGTPEDAETLAFEFSRDFHWDWQIHPESGKETFNSTIKDLSVSLDWSEGMFAEESLCDSAKVDLDLFIENADGSVGNYGGATGACPEEAGNLGLPDGTYGIYVQMYDADFPAAANAPIPYVVTFPKGISVEGTFNSNDANKTTHTVGKVVISGQTYTLYDKDGAELGSL